MTFTRSQCAAFILCLGALIGCGNRQPADNFVAKPLPSVPPATLTPGDEASLLPLDLGNQWVYTVQINRKNGAAAPIPSTYESTWKVVASAQTAKGTQATIESSRPGSKSGQQKWLTNSTGIYQLADGTPAVAFDPPFSLVLFPVQPGKEFTWTGTGPNGTGKPGKVTTKCTIQGSQVVDTDMGQMSAFAVEEQGSVQAGKTLARSETTVWLAPGVGIVRLYQRVLVGDQGYELLLKLKSKSLMKS